MPDAEYKHILELIPAYALNSLDADDATLVSQHLPGCESCQAEMAAYEGVIDLMPLAAPDVQPSTALKGRLMAQIQAAPTADRVAAVTHRQLKPERSWWNQISEAIQDLFAGPRWRPVLFLFIVALLVSNVLLWQRVNQQDDALPGWKQIALTGSEVAPQATGVIYINPNGLKGTLVVDRLPQLSPDEQYQLWLIQDGHRISGGVFSVDSDGYRGIQIESPQPLQNFGAFGITIEPAGGSPGPTGERVLGYNL
ncbi:MAG: anti-sigma factor [Anaerolineae bacterium]|nr:MAG: anti-sigma factor [Anaerolineae bacterium]